MALLEGRASVPRPARATSPHIGGRAQSPAVAASPIRSMLDIGDETSPRPSPRNSVAGINYGSMLGPVSPGRNSSRGPVPSSPPPSGRNASRNPESAYRFEMMPTIEAHSMPKRVTQGPALGKKKQGRAMSSVYGASSDMLGGTSHRERQASLGGFMGMGKPKTGSPGPSRSQSPGGRKLNTNSFNLMPDPQKYVTDSGKVIDLSSAYRRLSDGALLRSGGNLSSLPTRKGSDPAKGETLSPGGGVRLATDDFGDDEGAIQSSDEDYSTGSSDGEEWGQDKRRGRGRTRQDESAGKHGSEKKMPKSLLAAAEDERKSLLSDNGNMRLTCSR